MVWTHVRRRLIQRSQSLWAPTSDSRRPRSCLLQYCSNELPRNCHLVASTPSRTSIHEQWITRWVSSLEHKLLNSWRELQCSAVQYYSAFETKPPFFLLSLFLNDSFRTDEAAVTGVLICCWWKAMYCTLADSRLTPKTVCMQAGRTRRASTYS